MSGNKFLTTDGLSRFWSKLKTYISSLYAPLSRKINNKDLSADITLTASDVGAAAASHGNHVPEIETADNAKFLRNDNTWQTVTPANIGASASDHTHNYAGSSSAGGAATSAVTATNANNIKVTNSDGAWLDVTGVATGFTSGNNYAPSGHTSGSVSFYVDKNATSGNQRGILRLGNSTANTTAAGHNGVIRMYGSSTGYSEIVPENNTTSNVTLTLPSATGTVALTSSNITGSASKWGGYALSVVTALPASPNANTIYIVK